MKKLIYVAVLIVAVAGPAAANECMTLWLERNAYFANKGYCFGSALGKGVFGNSGCHTKNPNMSSAEQRRISQIQSREKALGCAAQKSRWSASQVRSYAQQLTAPSQSAPAPSPRQACSQKLELTFDMAAGVDLNQRLSVNGPWYVDTYADGSYAWITARGSDCISGTYSFNYYVEYSHLIDGYVPYNFSGNFSVGPQTRSCYITVYQTGGRPNINCN